MGAPGQQQGRRPPRRAAEDAYGSSSRSPRLAAAPRCPLRPRYPRRRGPAAGSLVASVSPGRRAALGSAAGMLRAQGRGAAGEEGAAAPPCLRFPGLGRERGRRVPGAGRARSGSGSAARRSGPHVTGGGAACSRHRPGGGSGGRAPAAGQSAPGAGAGAGPWTASGWTRAGSGAGCCAKLRRGPGGARLHRALCRPPASEHFFLFSRVGSGGFPSSSSQSFSFHFPCVHTEMERAELRGLGSTGGA